MVIAFRDISPKAPVHILVVPKLYIKSVDEIDQKNVEYIANIFLIIPKIARREKLDRGYKVITNVGEFGGQVVPHLHFHILGGERLDYEV